MLFNSFTCTAVADAKRKRKKNFCQLSEMAFWVHRFYLNIYTNGSSTACYYYTQIGRKIFIVFCGILFNASNSTSNLNTRVARLETRRRRIQSLYRSFDEFYLFAGHARQCHAIEQCFHVRKCNYLLDR